MGIMGSVFSKRFGKFNFLIANIKDTNCPMYLSQKRLLRTNFTLDKLALLSSVHTSYFKQLHYKNSFPVTTLTIT